MQIYNLRPDPIHQTPSNHFLVDKIMCLLC